MNSQISIEIFWTGGFDSTFRICQLSRKNVTIIPYYLSDDRVSEQMELHAIEVIRNKLISNPNTIAVIKPIQYIPKSARHTDTSVSRSFSSLLKQDFMGSQYEWLGTFALSHKGIELSIHKDDKAIALIQKHGALSLIEDSYGPYYVIDREKSSDDIITLFGNQHFPIANYTKLQMKQEYILMGLSDIIDDTWFCHKPINGKPCGICNPCIYTIQEGMLERFSEDALKRYYKQNSPITKVTKLIKQVFSSVLTSITKKRKL